MQFFDGHIHGRHSGGTSPNGTFSAIEKTALSKGLDIIGTGDILHRGWLDEATTYLTELGDTGLYKGQLGMTYVLSTEVECSWTPRDTEDSKRVHNLLFLRSFQDVKTLRDMLLRYSNMDFEGRPTVRLSCEQLVNYIKQVIPTCQIIPAHVWTPHTSALGEEGGFTSLTDCYRTSFKHIYAIETGLSSTPEMCSELEETAKLTQVSFSDAHKADTVRIGREATVLALNQVTFDQIFTAIKTRDSRFIGTIEVPPEYGKYHLSGHRFCGVSVNVKEFAEYNGFCTKCGNKLTVGVEQRIHELSHGYRKPTVQRTWTLIPLTELLSKMYSEQFVYNYWQRLHRSLGSEYNILMNATEFEIAQASNDRIARVVMLNREGAIKIIPGFDNEYGKVVLESEQEEFKTQSLAEVFSE